MSRHQLAEAGKTSLVVLTLLGFFTLAIGFFIDLAKRELQRADADTANSTVTVNNTAPAWTVDAQEQTESSATSPNNEGSSMAWVGTATDSNSDPYYLLICKTGGAPTANNAAAPTCNGGSGNQWAVSSNTSSGAQATASTTVPVGLPESNDWYAWICDSNGTLAQCNGTAKQGSGSTASPFVVNHRPAFTAFSDNSPTDPGSAVTFTATAADTDVLGVADTVKLFVCKSNDFTGTACGPGGTYATSSFSASNPTAIYTVVIPSQDKNWTAYGYVIDQHGLPASGGSHGTDSVLTVSNVAPTLSAATFSINNGTDITLSVEAGETTNASASFTVTDSNSCLNSSSGNEISSAIVNLYQSSIGSSGCDVAGEYNANYCYPAAVGTATWNYSCSQVAGTCSGASDSTATWRCTFPIWYVARPTDGSNATDSTWFADNWLVSASASDDNGAKSSLVEGTTGAEVVSFLGYNLNFATVSYGNLDPGSTTDPIVASISFLATGNVGLDQTLYGLAMCVSFPTCSGAPTDTIPVGQQKYNTSSSSYAAATTLLVSPGAELELNVPKSTLTTSQASRKTYWGIAVPSAITVSGIYKGQNTIIGVKGEAELW